MHRRRLVTAILTVTLSLGSLLVGCGLFGADPRDTAAEFLDAVARGDAAAAGRLTTDPVAATGLIQQVRDELKPAQVQLAVVDVQSGDRTASASFSVVWDLDRNRQWRYSGGFELLPSDAGWSVRWSPAVLHPRLAAQQRLALREVPAEPAPVVDRAGAVLFSWHTVVTVALDRAKTPDLAAVATRLADALAQFDPRITQESIIAAATAAPPGQSSEVLGLRENEYQSVRDRIYDLPGVSFPTQQQLVGPDRDFGAQLVPGIGGVAQEQLNNAAGWRVVTVNPSGAEVETLAVEQPRAVPTLTTTVDRAVQAAAEGALAAELNPAMIVAMQPSTGEILAVAQNRAADVAQKREADLAQDRDADGRGSWVLAKRFPPGSTFKIVTAVAALEAKLVTVDSLVACSATADVGQRIVANDGFFDLGPRPVPLRTAFARSCNTTFAQLATRLGTGALTDAAYQMGIGMNYHITGLKTNTGQVPPSDSLVRRAENGFGQGRVLASPFGMTLVAATVAAGGRTPTPVLFRGLPTQITLGPVAPIPRDIADAVRVMMRQAVTQGTATSLIGQGELFGKTGTAEDDPAGPHGWFVGFRGDLAFATLVVDGGSSGPALDASGRFLSALPRQ